MNVAIFDSSVNWKKRYTRELRGIEVIFPSTSEELEQRLKQGEKIAAVSAGNLAFLDKIKQAHPSIQTIYVGMSQSRTSRYDTAVQKGHKVTLRSGLSNVIRSVAK